MHDDSTKILGNVMKNLKNYKHFIEIDLSFLIIINKQKINNYAFSVFNDNQEFSIGSRIE